MARLPSRRPSRNPASAAQSCASGPCRHRADPAAPNKRKDAPWQKTGGCTEASCCAALPLPSASRFPSEPDGQREFRGRCHIVPLIYQSPCCLPAESDRHACQSESDRYASDPASRGLAAPRPPVDQQISVLLGTVMRAFDRGHRRSAYLDVFAVSITFARCESHRST